MTNGYFVIEEKGKIKKAVYLNVRFISGQWIWRKDYPGICRKTGIKIYGENISKFRFDG